MPRYDYECEPCERVAEVYHGLHQDPEVRCKVCRAPMRRLISAATPWTQPIQRTEGFEAISLPPGYEPARAAGCSFGPGGEVLITNPKRQVPEILAHPIAQRDGLEWEGRV